MLFSQIISGLVFYIAFSLFTLIGLPVTERIFSSKPAAYITAKMAGLIMFGYLIWLLGSFNILNYQNNFIIFGLFILGILSGAYWTRKFFQDSPSDTRLKKGQKAAWPIWKKILVMEVVTILTYVLYLILRSHNAEANGTERFMDMALMNAASKTHTFPFIDPWYAGKTVNYYYYGAYLMSLISKLSGTPIALGYNFALGLVFAQTTVLSATLGTLLTGLKRVGIVAAFLVTCAGTVFYAGCSISANLASPSTICSYASSTRLYTPSYIINEIPSYSFTVGDLHAHLLALPFFVFNLLLIYALVKRPKIGLPLTGLLALSYTTSGMINAWDIVTLCCLLAIAAGIRYFAYIKGWAGKARDMVLEKREAIKKTFFDLLIAGGIIAVAIILMIPNLVKFQSPVLGIGFIPSYMNEYQLHDVQWPTPLKAELGMWGALIGGIIIAMIAKRQILRNYLFPIALAILSVGIILGVEVVFIRDIYSVSNPPYFRANTTFKFGYHAWVMLSIAFAALVLPIRAHKDRSKFGPSSKINMTLVGLALIGGIIYPYQAMKQFYLTGGEKVLTLDGSDWMKAQMADDLATINYINENFSDRAVIAEAVGDSYSTYSRIATYTGMETPMGWTTHEWTWRLDADAAKKARPGITVDTGWERVATVMGDMEKMYTSFDVRITKQMIEKYKVQYIYVGDLEHQKYPDLAENNIKAVGTPIFKHGNSVLYKVN